MFKWLLVAVMALLPIGSTLSGLAGTNMVALMGLTVWWLVEPGSGGLVYGAWTFNLVSMRGFQLWRLRRDSPLSLPTGMAYRRLAESFPVTVREQNRASAALIVVGVIGAVRSGLAWDAVGVACGLVGAAILFWLQPRLFRTLPPPTTDWTHVAEALLSAAPEHDARESGRDARLGRIQDALAGCAAAALNPLRLDTHRCAACGLLLAVGAPPMVSETARDALRRLSAALGVLSTLDARPPERCPHCGA